VSPAAPAIDEGETDEISETIGTKGCSEISAKNASNPIDNLPNFLYGGVKDLVTDVTDMAEDPRLEQAFELIRAVVADADRRAADEIVARISGNRTVSHYQGATVHPSYPDKRAPHGSSQMLIDRALAEAGDNGLTVAGIMSKAETEFEKMVSASAVRNWLKENERKRPPRYRQVGGVWYLPDRGPKVKGAN